MTEKAERTTPAHRVARVLVDVPLAHLDRPFDYAVPAALDDQVQAGSRVKVRFAGREVPGFVLERVDHSDHPGRLAPLRRAVSPEPVLSHEIAELTELVAARYAGTRSDVLRLAVPPRHATVEKRESPPAENARPDPAGWKAAWSPYPSGPGFVDALATGKNPRAVCSVLPGDWPALVAQAAAAAHSSGRGVLLCVPDRRDLDRLDAALTTVLGEGRHVLLTADLGPAARYRAFLAVRRGAVRVVVGTRAAAFAPVRDLGLVAIWDDGDDLYGEPRAPYPHTREVLLLRAEQRGCAALLAGASRTVEAEYLLRTGWAAEILADRAGLRRACPRVAVTGATDTELDRDPYARSARLPRLAHDAIRAGLEHGPVLVQTPRRGYAAALACDSCRTPARCPHCRGPLHLAAPHRPPTCRWCGQERAGWQCGVCGGHGLRAPVIGEARTAEEIGRAFPAVPVRTSGGDRVLATVQDEPSIVVATPGAEPVAAGGYACVVLLDTWLMLTRTDLRTGEESLRRWLNAASLSRSVERGGHVVAVGEPGDPVLQALVRWDPGGFARREMTERQSTHLPPACRLATLDGAPDDVAAALSALDLPEGAEVLGPAPAPEAGRGARSDAEPAGSAGVRAVVRVPRSAGWQLSATLREMQGVRDAHKLPPVRVQVDPLGLG
ncbi:MAG TPA: primosomal protein N' [Nocardioidaceae bacterium]|nr:primosomal protein N' [Nocardioidaceae bacterium]